MNNFKKIGLTALAASLVSVSANAGEMSVAGSASVGIDSHTSNEGGKNITMGNQLTFTGGGELDNGLKVAISFVIDQADGVAPGTAPFDSHSITISSDAMGTIVIAGEGAGNAQSALDTTAAGDIWNNGFKAGATEALYVPMNGSDATSNKTINYTLPTLMEGVSVSASYGASGTGVKATSAFGVTYTGVEGLSVSYGVGENGSTVATASGDLTTMKASYAIGSFTGAYSNTESDLDSTGLDEEMSSFKLSYTISDNLSISYGEETHETDSKAVDEEFSAISVSYTTGGMTLSAVQQEAKGLANTAGVIGETERWKLGVSFAF